ncbi:MAG: signal peptidase I [Syntrophobacteraceae bacterium]|nr:signal peptidase I [Syntrophobacteraceae bacterium]
MNKSAGTQGEATKHKTVAREYTEVLVIAILLALFIRVFVVQAFKIPSGSMEPTLLVGDHILVNKFIYGLRVPFANKVIVPVEAPKQFDIVVFQYPKDPSVDYIKRVIGLPLQKIQIVDKKIYINDKLLKEPFGHYGDPRIVPGPRDNFGPVVVPANHYFMMGDNRDNSSDSRFWGFVPTRDLVGEAFVIYWSWRDSGSLSLHASTSFVRWDRFGKLLLHG